MKVRSIALVVGWSSLLAWAMACAGGGTRDVDDGAKSGSVAAAADSHPAPSARTPVKVARVVLDTLQVVVTAPGRTDVLRDQRVRAPFAGTLTALTVADGDRVHTDEVLGTLVTQNSEAALDGALAMLASAKTPGDSADARRALDLARSSSVTRTVRAPEAGIVLSHSASPGDRLAEGDEIVRIAAAGSSIFLADVAQNDLAQVRAGQPAAVRLPASGRTIAGVVHGILPSASSTAFSAPVRIDFKTALDVPSVGLFGTATVTVGKAIGVLSVPEDALLTDDIRGTSQVALVGPDARAHWIVVRPGVRDRGRVEVVGTGLAAGDQVIVSGQVGLPEGTPVVATP